jgi:acyl-CoA thioesterase-1
MITTIKPTVLSWTILLFMMAVILLAGVSCDSSPSPEQQEPAENKPATDNRGVIVAMGDSLTSGLGVPPEDAYPAQLERLLAERGHDYRVINAGISGETSSGARSRVDWVLKLNPDIVILETGANDGLRGIDPALVEDNIEQIIVRLKQEDITIVLAGMMMVTNLGKDYIANFNSIYPRLAQKHQVILMPFFLQDTATETSKNQADGIHPNSEGYRIITANLLPFVEKAITSDSQ